MSALWSYALAAVGILGIYLAGRATSTVRGSVRNLSASFLIFCSSSIAADRIGESFGMPGNHIRGLEVDSLTARQPDCPTA